MTTEEKQELLDAIKSESIGVDELEQVLSLDGVSSLPAVKGKTLVSVPLSLLGSQDAGAFVQVGVQDSLAAALRAVAHRRAFQVVSFATAGSLQRKTVALWIAGLAEGDEVTVYINGGSGNYSGIFTAEGSDARTCNERLYEELTADEAFMACIYSSSCSGDWETMVFELKETLGDAAVEVSALRPTSATAQPSVSLKTVQPYRSEAVESYQLMRESTDDSVYLNTENWEPYVGTGIWNMYVNK